MYLVVSNEFLAAIANQSSTFGEIWGEASDNDSVVRLLHPRSGTRKLGYWLHSNAELPTDQLPAVLTGQIEAGQLVAAIAPGFSKFYQLQENGTLLEQPYELMHLYADYHARIKGLFDSESLGEKKVAIVGLGTGGSAMAAALAKSGVGHFVLIDFDRLKVHNLARHICGLKDLGRFKTDAVQDYLYNTSPAIQVETHNFDITTDLERLRTILKDCDLVVGATDSEAAKGLLNQISWPLGLPVVYGAAHNMGFRGDIFLAEPPDGPCYECFHNATTSIFDFEPPSDVELDYGKMAAQPALGLDVNFISLIAARVGLLVLLKDDASNQLQGFPTKWILWGNQVEEGWFEQPLQSDYYVIEPDLLCPVCHKENYIESQLKISLEEARAEGRVLLDNLKNSAS